MVSLSSDNLLSMSSTIVLSGFCTINRVLISVFDDNTTKKDRKEREKERGRDVKRDEGIRLTNGLLESCDLAFEDGNRVEIGGPAVVIELVDDSILITLGVI